MEIQLSKDYELIPEWNGNKKDDKPIVFKCRIINENEKQQCFNIVTIDGKTKVEIDQGKLFKFALKSIENLTLNNSEIKSANEFLEADGLSGLFNEVIGEIIKKSMSPDIKKL